MTHIASKTFCELPVDRHVAKKNHQTINYQEGIDVGEVTWTKYLHYLSSGSTPQVPVTQHNMFRLFPRFIRFS